MNEIINNTKTKLDGAINHLEGKFTEVRATGAHPSMLNSIEVEYYETMTPLNQIASITAPDATQLILTPFDKSAVKDIVSAIGAANIGLSPVDEGDKIRIPVPPLTAETREKFSKEAKEIAEQAKISVRTIRQEANKKVQNSEASENEEKVALNDIQKLVDEANKKIEEMLKVKIDSIMKV